MKDRRTVLSAALLAALLVAFPAPVPAAAGPPGGPAFDPSGVWTGRHGPLALMLAGGRLTFSYTGPFGPDARMCDGIGVARSTGEGTWEYADSEGTVTFTARGGKVTVAATKGIASFCGAGWPGDTFRKDGWKPPFGCTVVAPKASFLTASASPEETGESVSKGDAVEAVGLVNEGTPGWLLTRAGKDGRRTAGLLERDALECRDE